MNRYGKLACLAADFLQTNNVSPTTAWDTHAEVLFKHSQPSRDKGCPKKTLLGLAEAGLLNKVEIAIENRTKNSVNKDYAVKAYELICADRSYYLIDQKRTLAEGCR